MIVDEKALYAVTARFFKGLGDPARLRILEFLRTEEKSVSEIVERQCRAISDTGLNIGEFDGARLDPFV